MPYLDSVIIASPAPVSEISAQLWKHVSNLAFCQDVLEDVSLSVNPAVRSALAFLARIFTLNSDFARTCFSCQSTFSSTSMPLDRLKILTVLFHSEFLSLRTHENSADSESANFNDSFSFTSYENSLSL